MIVEPTLYKRNNIAWMAVLENKEGLDTGASERIRSGAPWLIYVVIIGKMFYLHALLVLQSAAQFLLFWVPPPMHRFAALLLSASIARRLLWGNLCGCTPGPACVRP